MTTELPSLTHRSHIKKRFVNLADAIPSKRAEAFGKLVKVTGETLEVSGLRAGIGARCSIERKGKPSLNAEVIGFDGDRLILACEELVGGVSPGAFVTVVEGSNQIEVGDALLGRVLDGAGKPFNGEPVFPVEAYPLRGRPLNPLDRNAIGQPIDTGVRAINSLLTLGRGQRVGLFAGSGVGKSTLLGMITRFSAADVVVVCLVGERGREVKEFVEESLGEEGLKRAVVIATPADTSPLLRVSGCWRATAVAEYYRSRGLNVLLLMDSLTRFAQAQRELSLSAGEPPVSKGYTPSVFSSIPNLIERAGILGSGSITAIYTVLVEGDDLQDPISDVARASLDGHIVLSRDIADQGTYPAIDIEKSISRSMLNIAEKEHLANAKVFRKLYVTHEQNKDLISLGAYRLGTDKKIDLAISFKQRMSDFLSQPIDYASNIDADIAALKELSDEISLELYGSGNITIDSGDGNSSVREG